jgi:hypothetical protein
MNIQTRILYVNLLETIGWKLLFYKLFFYLNYENGKSDLLVLITSGSYINKLRYQILIKHIYIQNLRSKCKPIILPKFIA